MFMQQSNHGEAFWRFAQRPKNILKLISTIGMLWTILWGTIAFSQSVLTRYDKFQQSYTRWQKEVEKIQKAKSILIEQRIEVQVANEHVNSPFLQALRESLSDVSLCGGYSCISYITTFFFYVNPLYIALFVLAVITGFITLPKISFVSRQTRGGRRQFNTEEYFLQHNESDDEDDVKISRISDK